MLFSQDTANIIDEAESDDRFGESLASGNFNEDAYDDLAIGAPGENMRKFAVNERDVGVVHILHGSALGLSAIDSQWWHRARFELDGRAVKNALFGYALAAGDFNADGADDLAIGVPGDTVDNITNAGAVNVVYGTSDGLIVDDDQLWHQDSPGVKGVSEDADVFGFALASGHFDSDTYADLAIGVPGEDIGSIVNAGAINVLFGGSSGITVRDQLFHQDTQGIQYGAEVGDTFGTVLTSGDYDGDGLADVTIGVPGEAMGPGNVDVSAGAVSVIYGGESELTTRDQVWHQGSSGIEGLVESYEWFSGEVVSVGVYRIAYADGTTVRVSQDHMTHNPIRHIDMRGQGEKPHELAAAGDGWIRIIVDTNEEPTDANNYVWIEHPNGEWTKYSHMRRGSVISLGHVVGDWVTAGTPIGIEDDVGRAHNEHLHFQVSRPNDPSNPVTSGGFIIGESLTPVICNIPGNRYIRNEVYVAGGC